MNTTAVHGGALAGDRRGGASRARRLDARTNVVPDARRPLATRVLGGFYLSMGGVHLGIVLSDPQTYGGFADGSPLGFVRTGWSEIFMSHPAGWGLVMALGETVLGVMLLLGARTARVAWAGALAFQALLVLFGWGFALWSVPALALLLPLARRDWALLAAPTGRGAEPLAGDRVLDGLATGRTPGVGRWVGLLALAEAVGMAAAATAAQATTGDSLGRDLSLVVAGGLVEGLVVGLALARLMRPVIPSALTWVATTVLVAGVGWALGSYPAASPAASVEEPRWWLMLLAAAALGAMAGAVLGAAQAAVSLRRRVRHPWRWVVVSAAAWVPAMVVIFVGATLPEETWSTSSVLVVAVLTGLVAGSALGAVTWVLVPALQGPRELDVLVLQTLTLRHRHRRGRGAVGLRVLGARSGRPLELPVEAARDGEGWVVAPGHAERKTWWRNVKTRPEAAVMADGRWHPVTARLLYWGETGYAEARTAYLERWPHSELPEHQPLVRLAPAGDDVTG